MSKPEQQPKAAGTRLSLGHWASLLVLLLGIGGSALGVVQSTYTSRHLRNDLNLLEQERNALQVEWGRLLLEQSSLVAQGKVEDTAIAELNMKVPAIDNIVVLRSE